MRKRYFIPILFATILMGALTAAGAFAGGSSQVPSTPVTRVTATAETGARVVHVVKWGETLSSIARRYGVSVRELAAYNGIANPDRIFAGQRLRIPPASQPTPAPQPPAPTPAPITGPEEEIVIQSPRPGVTVTNPVIVSGLASSPFEQTVAVAVLDATGGQIGGAAAVITGELGQRGPFSVTVPFTVPANSQPGRIQVFTTSPRDGALEHLSSVSAMLQGADLDVLLRELEAAVNLKDYGVLQSLMGPKFSLDLYQSAGNELTPEAAIQRLRETLMGPGQPRLDFSVDARALVGSRVDFGPEVAYLAYSTGWGANRNDDAFLMIGDVDGRARWIGLLYVPHALIDYRVASRVTTG